MSNLYTPDEIQAQMLKTWGSADATIRDQRLHAVLGLAGETGEVAELIKKGMYKPGYDLTPEALMDELSDVLYYVAVLSSLYGFGFAEMTSHLAGKLSDGHGWTEGTD